MGDAVFGDLTCCRLQWIVGVAWDFCLVFVLDAHFLLCNYLVLNRGHQRTVHVPEAGTGALARAGGRRGSYGWAPCLVKLDMVISPM